MKIIEPGYEILFMEDADTIYKRIELVGRTCYKSEDKITAESAPKFLQMLLKRGHEAMIEFSDIIVKFICDRGVSHEIVRHRLCSFAQESTRFCNYSKDKSDNQITVIRPPFWDNYSVSYNNWLASCEKAERAYLDLLISGASPQEARSVLPNSLKTEIVVKANLREWRWFFKKRADVAAHPQMRQIVLPLLKEFKARLPIVFDDIEAPLTMI
jgi:thymidylate synthase (FAD)